MERMRIDGAELEYEVSGTGEPVILIHGALIADAFWPLRDEPSLRGRYQLIVYHRRGYAGSSRTSRPVSVDHQAADCRAVLCHLGVERAHVVGHSYGGAVALQLGLDTPDMVHSLAVLEPALIVGASAQSYRASLVQGAQHFREAGVAGAAGAAGVVDEFLRARWPGYNAPLDQLLPDAFDQAVTDAETWFEHEMPGLLKWNFGEAEVRCIRQPTLSMLGGQSDALWPRFGEVHQLLLAHLPRAEAFVLPDAAHFLQLEDRRGMAEALAAFWARHPLPARDVWSPLASGSRPRR
jgi:pimeloyl-ACP methyl ester carboxylesterase